MTPRRPRSPRSKNAVAAAFEALAGPSLLSIVLASSPVYAFAPPNPPSPATPSTAAPKAAPKKDAKATAPAKAAADKPAPKSAGAKPGAKAGTKAGAKSTAGKPVPGGKTVLDEEILIEGKLEKPSAYYILRRSSLDYDWARLTAEFSPLVLESVQDPLF
jgi:hypothetical protein